MKTHILRLLWVITCLHMILSTNAQKAEAHTAQNPCLSKGSCSECIQTPSCAWCMAPNMTDQKRCFQESISQHCPEEYVWNPDHEERIIINKNMTEYHEASISGGGGMIGGIEGSWGEHGSSSGHGEGHASGGWGISGGSSGGYGQSIVQVAPQRISLKLRARQVHKISMHYTQAKDYPVDLYYLMDLSKSMEDDKYKLSILGNDLAEAMRKLTRDFRLGFGSFVDKVVMPYVSTVKEKLKQPCESCAAPYGFKNHLSLNNNTSQFSDMVANAAVSGNLDAPEGGFDAIMQAIVCREEIGWRDQARRLLVFSTDAGFHYAGDGKLGGIVKPNDGKCHLQNGMYTHSDKQDYPSISQINLKVKQNAINVIFAVTEEQIHIYKQLQANIEGASSGILSNDSSNVVDFVKSQYEAISSTVEMRDNAGAHLKLTYWTRCLNKTNTPLAKTNKCGNIKVGDKVSFEIHIEVISCPKDPKDWKQTLQIYPVGINESLTIDLELLCSCPCEHPGDQFYIPNARECNYFGTYKCGLCYCNEPYFGRHCECSATDVDIHQQSEKNCIAPNSTLECWGRGNCVCGKCDCQVPPKEDMKIYGDYCECDNFSCDRHEKQICSGKSHGVCECGVCRCFPPWGGDACECRLSNDTCYPKDVVDGELCSGHGECKCGHCVCEDRYSGQFCEKCPTCTNRCEEFKECVQCQMYGTGKYNESYCLETCTKFTPISVKHVEATEENENLCNFFDENDCRFSYVYYYNEQNKIVIKAQEEPECPAKVFLLGIVLGVIAAIVLIGLAILLLWKLFTTIHDRREFAKFEKERMMAKWDTGENPIYKQATSTFKNPTYAGKG